MVFFFGLLNLQFDLYNAFHKLFYQKPQINGVLYPCYYAAIRVSHCGGLTPSLIIN